MGRDGWVGKWVAARRRATGAPAEARAAVRPQPGGRAVATRTVQTVLVQTVLVQTVLVQTLLVQTVLVQTVLVKTTRCTRPSPRPLQRVDVR